MSLQDSLALRHLKLSALVQLEGDVLELGLQLLVLLFTFLGVVGLTVLVEAVDLSSQNVQLLVELLQLLALVSFGSALDPVD